MDRTALLAGVIAAVLLTACSSGPKVVVGSKNFTEQVVLGEIVAQHLERRLQIAVERRLNLGGTLLAHEGLRSGGIDLYPEYTGTALTAILKQPPPRTAGAALAQVREEYQRRWQLTWLQPLGFDNTFAMVVRGKTAREQRLATLSDAARVSGGWKLGVGFEFLQRPDGWPGLSQAYGMRLAGEPVAMDLGLIYQALEAGQVDLVAGNATDGLLAARDLRVLADDKHYFPPYECGIVVRDEALRRVPGLQAALAELNGRIDAATMRQLNYAVDGEHRAVEQVAAGFLQGLTARR